MLNLLKDECLIAKEVGIDILIALEDALDSWGGDFYKILHNIVKLCFIPTVLVKNICKAVSYKLRRAGNA